MNLSDIISPSAIITELKASDKMSVLAELVEPITVEETGLDRDQLVRILLDREKLGSTGIGEGIAIPHGKVEQADRLLVSFGRSREGIDFDSIDGQPARLFFLLLAPESSTGSHLKALAKLSRLLKNQSFRDRLTEAQTAQQIYDLILEEEDKA